MSDAIFVHGLVLHAYHGVMQHEGKPFRRRQRLQHHQQRRADIVGHLRLAFIRIVRGRFRHMRPHRFLAARFPRPQHVQAHPRDDRGQPTAQVLDGGRVRPGQPQPGLLHGVIDLAALRHERGSRRGHHFLAQLRPETYLGYANAIYPVSGEVPAVQGNEQAIAELKGCGYHNVDEELDILGYLERYTPTWKHKVSSVDFGSFPFTVTIPRQP